MKPLWRALTQTRPDDSLQQAVVAAGGVLDEADLIVRHNRQIEAIRHDWAAAGPLDWVVVTSPYTVEVLASHLAAWLPRRTRLAAVGAATAAALTGIGLPPDLVPTSGPAGGVGLAAVFPPGTGKVLLPGAATTAGTLEPGLAELGWQVVALPVYATTPAPAVHPVIADRWAQGNYDVLVATSGSVAEAAASLLGPNVPVVAFGRSGAATALRCGFPLVAQARSTSPDDVVHAIIRLRRKAAHG